MHHPFVSDTLIGRFASFRTALVIVLAALAAVPTPAWAAQASDACAITTTARVVAVADVHGAFDNFVRLLREAGLINGSNRWIGKNAHLVQLGDVLDRGADSRKVLDLLQRLEREAPREGGQVHALLGNHEVMRMMRDLRYVSDGEYAAFRSGNASELRERFYELSLDRAAVRTREAQAPFDERAFRAAFLKEVPLGFVEMQIAFESEGAYGRWLRQRVAMVRINDVLFVHGGVSPTIAPLGCAGVNAGVRKELADLPALGDPRAADSLVAGPEGPLWYRGLADTASTLTETDVDALLRAFNSGMIVVGHTVSPDATPRLRFGNRVLQIDTGMLNGSFYPGGSPVALEFDGRQVSLIHIGRRQPLFTRPPTAASAQ